MVLCPSCGHENPEEASFCMHCGARTESACPNCGKPNVSEASFCISCGAKLSEMASIHTRTPAPTHARPTSFASDRYQVQRFLGEGGRKRVYMAHDTKLDRDVAIAVIKTEGLDADGLTRIRREAQAMGRLGDHPHIVTVFDIGDEQGQPYIVSQYMEGGDLQGRLRGAENHRLPLDLAKRIASEVQQALEHAHSRGIIHRDLKPGNIWLTRDGTAKLGDFGLAVAVDRSRLTVEGMMVGTVAYMAPEQALGRQPDARSDLYSWGCVLYEMVTGRPPFLGDDAVAIISQHINTAPVAPTWHNPEVPRALESLIMRCLAKNPGERPESAAALPEALSAAITTARTTTTPPARMEANPLDRLAGGVFVGREKEMDELRAGLEDSLSGRGRLLMLVGEPGIGKTRTSEELATYARLCNTQVLWGRCYEGEGAPAYWPWVQVIRSYVHDRDPAALMSEMGPGAADIAQVVSDVKERLPGLPVPPALEPEQARFRLFDSITTFLKNASKGQPIVLVLDDLHWADKPSLLLLQFLARELRGARLLVVGTYRNVELRRQHPLTQSLGELSREGVHQRILLRGISERDVARFIELTAGRTPPERLVEAVFRETEGNPFFVNEIVRLLVADGRLERPEEVTSWSVTIPQSVREVVGRRLDHLSEACNSVLSIASVVGREFGLDTLDGVGDVHDDRLLETLEEAIGARVIAEMPKGSGRYSFTHALIRETLYEELSSPRRVRLHRQIGEALEDMHAANPEPHLAELAYHFFEGAKGGDPEKAINYGVQAAERALSLTAYEDAARFYEIALQGLELKSKPDRARRCELLLALGEAQRRTGDRDRSRDTFLSAAAIARQIKRPNQLVRAAVGYGGRVHGFPFDPVELGLLEEALENLDSDSPLRATALARLSMGLRGTDAQQRSQEALDMARRLGEPHALLLSMHARQVALETRAGPRADPERLLLADELVQRATDIREAEMALVGRTWRVTNSLELGDVRAVDAEIECIVRMARELRQPVYQSWAARMLATRAAMAGRFDEGERMALESLTIARAAHHVVGRGAELAYGAQIMNLRVLQGRPAEVEPAATALVGGNPNVVDWRVALAAVHSEMGSESEARTEFEQLAEEKFSGLPADDFWLINLGLLSEVCAYLGDSSRATDLYDLLLPCAQRTILLGFPTMICRGSASRNLALLATTMGRWDDAVTHFEAALEMNARMGARPWLAYTQQGYAHMLLRRGRSDDRTNALSMATEALALAQEIGMRSLVEKALALKLQAQGIDPTKGGTSIEAVAASVYDEKPNLHPHAAPDGTVTILFSDIQGSTAINERLGDRRWLEVLREHNAIIRREVKRHGGFEVKSAGDGFMVAFQSASRAIECAVAVQRTFAKRNESAAEPIQVRIGMHTGEVTKDGSDFFGRHVNLAARIAGQAQGGEILVSSLLKELVEGAGDMAVGEGREVELKGLKRNQMVFKVEWGG